MKIQLVEREILAALDSVKISEDLDLGYQHIKGISVLESAGRLCTLESFSIDGKEVLPKGFEVEFFQSNVAVPGNQRFFTLDAKGSKINMDFKDGGSPFSSYPFTLKIYLLIEK